ncbi:MAG: agmatinase [Vicinamibacterales bacterium]|jgi:agmatinase|nr:agmatinase [Vicinamibacterales bacterium]
MAHDLPYHAQLPFTFGALEQDAGSFDRAGAVILPVPFERTTSYVPGTKNGPREIIAASGQVELYDEELGREICDAGIHTLPAMESPFASTEDAFAEMRRVSAWLAGAGKFFIALGGEHALTAPLVAGVAGVHPGVTVLQIDAHADLRESYMGDRHSHASAMRRVLEYAPAVQVAIRNLSAPEAEAIPGLNTTVFYDWNMRDDPAWMTRIVDALGEKVYITIDCDGIDPAVMPAVGTPEPGGLTWRELLTLLKLVMTNKTVVAADVVELCPIPGLVAPTFLAARLVYKLIGYRFFAR